MAQPPRWSVTHRTSAWQSLAELAICRHAVGGSHGELTRLSISLNQTAETNARCRAWSVLVTTCPGQSACAPPEQLGAAIFGDTLRQLSQPSCPASCRHNTYRRLPAIPSLRNYLPQKERLLQPNHNIRNLHEATAGMTSPGTMSASPG